MPRRHLVRARYPGAIAIHAFQAPTFFAPVPFPQPPVPLGFRQGSSFNFRTLRRIPPGIGLASDNPARVIIHVHYPLPNPVLIAQALAAGVAPPVSGIRVHHINVYGNVRVGQQPGAATPSHRRNRAQSASEQRAAARRAQRAAARRAQSGGKSIAMHSQPGEASYWDKRTPVARAAYSGYGQDTPGSPAELDAQNGQQVAAENGTAVVAPLSGPPGSNTMSPTPPKGVVAKTFDSIKAHPVPVALAFGGGWWLSKRGGGGMGLPNVANWGWPDRY